ncbi:DUF5017 domain-containing protein [Chitinophaga alhagiae]|uniref:DUF5017 domain-containing protein n=1 Tax=Chitinophaga alhagiae TaxID=2203219 RepID=UPI000E5B8BEB|nr:DUF5017 domain-containing protein [Chitinophaga alhagiae]
MKRIILFLVVPFMAACSKDMKTDTPLLEVTVQKAELKAGDTARFNISTNANILSFYSGEVLSDYAFHKERKVILDSVMLSFSTSLNYGTQKDQFTVFASNDFNGQYTVEGLNAATWQNITSWFKLAPGNSNTAIAAGVKKINSLAVPGKPLYIGYRFIVKPQTANGGSKLWTMTGFNVSGYSDLGVQTLADHKSAGWQIIAQGPHDPGRGAVIQAAQLAFFGNNLDYKEEYMEDWVISKPINLEEVDLGPDWGAGIKTLADPPLKEYAYVFSEPGTYTVTFVGLNVNSDSESRVVRQLSIKVTP